MTDETVNNGADAAPVADDLRSTITAAIEKQRAAQSEDPAPAEAAASSESETGEQPEGDGAGERARDENGRFKAAGKPQDAKEAAVDPKEPKEPKSAEQAAEPDPAAAAHRPPPGWSPKSKAAFDSLPAEVKADIAKREVEVNQGLAKLADFKGVERFAEMAKRGGTTLENALTNYTNWEGAFKRDAPGAVLHLAGNLKIHPVALANEILRRAGASAQPQPGNAPTPQQPQIQLPPQLLEEITGLKSSLTQLQQERQAQEMNATTQNVETFFNDPKNKYADNVSDIMVGLIKQARANGEKPNLSAIYDQACWMHPEVRDLLINERLATNNSPPAASNPATAAAAANQARQAAKAVTGAPSRGVPPGNAPPANESVRDTILRAVAQQRGT